MKILLVCAGGMSTSLLVKKMEEYWSEEGIPLAVKAVGLGQYKEQANDYDMILLGPQVRYRLNEIKTLTKMPCATIDSMAYAMGDCPVIMKLAQKLLAEME
ncbi:PTS sugar transporter subunit IIB [Vagococcus coleopterorum]|uniref:PTS sugar transporter subunit IIB n=1 Tax=Vagococcus coleopterorum TaxID=2714946 RepID=A0A6G8APG2_9ENTE|nr:PTS sugar transporter subunit IIB [Vagococcus coleopterorum]QIL46832.1 PTS sugar transporter subunit IIB [Vagococcus coleopterorum]